jgi:hypothetical protein
MLKAKLHDTIVAAIPRLVASLKTEGYGVSSSVISSLAKIANHGESRPNIIATELTYIHS